MNKKDQDALAKLYMENYEMSEFETEAPYKEPEPKNFDNPTLSEDELTEIYDTLSEIAAKVEDSGILGANANTFYAHIKGAQKLLEFNMKKDRFTPEDY